MSKEIEAVKNNQKESLELKNIITKIQAQQIISIEMERIEERISKCWGRTIEINLKNREEDEKRMSRFRDLMGSNNGANIHVMGVPKEEDKKYRAEEVIKKKKKKNG